METQNENIEKAQNTNSGETTREGNYQEGGYTPRPRQRVRIGQRAAYSSDHGPRQGYRPQRSNDDNEMCHLRQNSVTLALLNGALKLSGKWKPIHTINPLSYEWDKEIVRIADLIAQ